MKEQKKKRLIAILLLVSCFISGYMLFATSEGGTKRLQNLAQADSLILDELADFNVNEQQIQTSTTRVDSHFSRKTYLVGVPYQFSKTQFHAELNNSLYQYSIQTPAKVTFPEENVNIHLAYKGNIIRSVSLQTDPKLAINRDRASLLVTFDELPSQDLISRLISMGEPIPVVLKVENPMQANRFIKKLKGRYNRILFWIQNEDGEDMLKTNPSAAIQKLKQLEDVLPQAHILQFETGEQTQQKLVANTDLTYINASDALLLHEGMGKASFFEGFHKLQTRSDYSMAVITGNETTLTWLQEKLPELKKAGIELVSPS